MQTQFITPTLQDHSMPTPPWTRLHPTAEDAQASRDWCAKQRAAFGLNPNLDEPVAQVRPLAVVSVMPQVLRAKDIARRNRVQTLVDELLEQGISTAEIRLACDLADAAQDGDGL